MRSTHRGITLIELMIVVTIVGILASVAYPSYREYVVRSGRTEAKVALSQAASDLEKCFTRNMRFTSNAGDCPVADRAAAGFVTEDGKYRISVVDAAALTATTFVLTATPQGAQSDDAECGNFTLNERGVRGISGSGTVARCW